MELVSTGNILIVGLGLIGGSYARTLKKFGMHVIGLNRSKESVDYALSEGIIDIGEANINSELIAEADAIVIALYPGIIKQWILDNQHKFKPGIYITDVTGVKSSIVYDIQSVLRDDVEFIGAHPMAGREKCGVKYSEDNLFANANYIVTPTDKNTEEAIEWCKSLGRLLGSGKISVLSPKEHDEMIGFVSQLTHVLAVSLMNSNDNQHLADYTGDSFRDLTRIARINENMWSELFLLNKEALLAQTDNFISVIQKMRDMIANDDRDGLCEMMRTSTARRAWFDK